MNFIKSYKFLSEHPIFENAFKRCLEFEVTVPDTQTRRRKDDEIRSTKPQVHLRCGPLMSDVFGDYVAYDVELDCASDTFESAIVKLAKLVRKKYGTREKPEPFDEDSLPVNVRL